MTTGLFAVTALSEIVGCYLPYLWLRKSGSSCLLLPAFISLALFAWLLSLHPTAAGRVYAAYGGVYVTVALSLALAGRWRTSDPLGPARSGRYLVRDGNHHPGRT